jgi:hypothetical protein
MMVRRRPTVEDMQRYWKEKERDRGEQDRGPALGSKHAHRQASMQRCDSGSRPYVYRPARGVLETPRMILIFTSSRHRPPCPARRNYTKGS